jgi:hypothetical protein
LSQIWANGEARGRQLLKTSRVTCFQFSEASVRRIWHTHGLKTSSAADLQGESGSQVCRETGRYCKVCT